MLCCYLLALLFQYGYFETVDGVRAASSMRTTRRVPMSDIFESEEEADQSVSPFTNLAKDSIFEQGETRDFLHFLQRIKYDHRQIPERENGEAVDISVSIVVSNIRAVSEVTMDYNLEMFYREEWIDSRLVYNKEEFKNKTEIALHESYTNFIWHPDTFMPNAVASKNPHKQSISHRSLLRLGENGTLLYSRRLSVVAECPMDLTLFPFDTQVCKLGIESYGYTADHVRYMWSKSGKKPIILHNISLPDFAIKEAFVTTQEESYATGNYIRLYVCFVFSRSAGFCYLTLIIPSTAIVITAWVALWLESETSFQDMISVILTITFLLFSYNEVMPRVSYIKAMDIYLGVCFCIVFLALIKLAMVKYMRQRLRITSDSSYISNTAPILQVSATNGLRQRHTEIGSSAPSVPNEAPLLQKVRTTSGSTYIAIPMAGSHSKRSPAKRCSKASSRGSITSTTSVLQFSPRFMRRFHWISQMAFLVGFLSFCLFYFLVFPSIKSSKIDPACDRGKAEWMVEMIH